MSEGKNNEPSDNNKSKKRTSLNGQSSDSDSFHTALSSLELPTSSKPERKLTSFAEMNSDQALNQLRSESRSSSSTAFINEHYPSANSSIFGQTPVKYNDFTRRKTIEFPPSGCVRIPLRSESENEEDNQNEDKEARNDNDETEGGKK